MSINKMKRIYLDYAATTPVDPAVLRAMQPYFSEKFGNAGSLHSFGQEAMAALDRSREIIATSIGADFREIIFTGSATEVNNLVLRGVAARSSEPRIIVSSVEHESVLETARDLDKEGVDVVYLPVDKTGLVDLKKLEASLNENTVLVSVMYANNEIGTIQQVAAIAKIISDFRSQIANRKSFGAKEKSDKCPTPGAMPLFHTDASQAFQFLDCSVLDRGVDFMTFSSHKIYGPKGVGALYMKQTSARSPFSAPLSPVMTGGDQEFGLRSGTENIPAIVGFAKAVELLVNLNKLTNKNIANLRDELWRGIKKIYPKAEINGTPITKSSECKNKKGNLQSLPNILNVYFPGREAQDLLTKFDLHGLAVSSGSACRARASLSSYVIEELGYSKERARSSIRFSLGRPTMKKEIAHTLRIIEKALL